MIHLLQRCATLLFLACLGLTLLSAAACGGADVSESEPVAHPPARFAAAPAVPAKTPAAVQPARALWVWNNLPVVDPKARAELFATVRKFGINRLFQQVQPLLQTHPAEVLDFVRDAKLHGLQVELLLGGHGWTHPDYHKVALDRQQRALALAKTEPGLIAAIHYDIEPHALPTWKKRWPALTKDWLDLVTKLQQAQAGSGVALHMDIPAWYEDIVVLYQGQEASLLQHVLQRVDGVAVMAYTDTLQQSLPLVQSELQVARKLGKTMYLGLNLRCDPGQPGLCRLRAGQLPEVLRQLEGPVLLQGGTGTALHDYEGLVGLGM
jgi:hypothetical protein